MGERFVFRHLDLLGTVIEVRVVADGAGPAAAADRAAIDEVTRLQSILSARDQHSALRRWARAEADPTPEVDALLAVAERWRVATGGAFHPAAGRLFAAWSDAAADDRLPSDADLAEAVASLDDPSTRRRWCDPTAVAKGWIVDRAADLAMAVDGVTSVLVNAGGDLRHLGEGTVAVGIEDPARPYDNVPPLDRVELADGAVATSGGARRWWTIDGRRYPQVLDPRTGRPVDRVAAASIVAPDAATADALATALVVLGPGDGVALVEGIEGVEGLVVEADGTVTATSGWPGRFSAR
ncbi:MAG: FAD:protein FMN transferase [Actinobacteria bacterium]|nr:FAD:protein FMN transferase [Actinomycetota bacterium]